LYFLCPRRFSGSLWFVDVRCRVNHEEEARMKKRSTTYRDGREIKAPRGITAAQLQLMHDAYWPDKNLSAEERAMKAARLVKAHDDSRRASGNALSIKARQANKAERNQRWRVDHASGKTLKQIATDEKVDPSTVWRVVKPSAKRAKKRQSRARPGGQFGLYRREVGPDHARRRAG
jgi:hypothetical protein